MSGENKRGVYSTFDFTDPFAILTFLHLFMSPVYIIIIIISTREVAPSAKAGINGEPQIQVTVNDNRLKIGK